MKLEHEEITKELEKLSLAFTAISFAGKSPPSPEKCKKKMWRTHTHTRIETGRDLGVQEKMLYIEKEK